MITPIIRIAKRHAIAPRTFSRYQTLKLADFVSRKCVQRQLTHVVR